MLKLAVICPQLLTLIVANIDPLVVSTLDTWINVQLESRKQPFLDSVLCVALGGFGIEDQLVSTFDSLRARCIEVTSDFHYVLEPPIHTSTVLELCQGNNDFFLYKQLPETISRYPRLISLRFPNDRSPTQFVVSCVVNVDQTKPPHNARVTPNVIVDLLDRYPELETLSINVKYEPGLCDDFIDFRHMTKLTWLNLRLFVKSKHLDACVDFFRQICAMCAYSPWLIWDSSHQKGML